MDQSITQWRSLRFSWRAVLLAFFIGAVCGWLRILFIPVTEKMLVSAEKPPRL